MLRFGIAAAVVCLFLWPAVALASTGPSLLGSAANSSSLSGTTSVAVSGPYAYTTAYWPGQLTVLDISNPGAPTVVGATPPTLSLENASNVTISGSDAFVVSKNRNLSTSSNDDLSGNSLTVVDISNPTNPVVNGTLHDSSQLFGSYGVAVAGQFAYVASQGILAGQPTLPRTSYGAFSVIDLATMTIVGHIDNGSLPAPWTNNNVIKHTTSVAISGHYAYVTAFYDDRVTVIDIATPSSPVVVASLRDAANLVNPADLALQGNYLYVANQVNFSSQLTVVNISNPAKPVVAGSLNNSLLEGGYRIRVRGNFAYVSGSNVSTISAVDISDSANPRLAGSVTDSAHLFTTTGLDLDGSGRYVIASSPLLSTDTGAKFPPYPGSGAPATTGTISVIDMDPSPISVAIQSASEPPNPTTQNSASFSFSVNDSVSAVQCGLDGAPLGACSTPISQNYAALSAGSHTFTVHATDAAGNTSSASYTWAVGTPPSNSAPPTVSGSAVPGQTLTAVSGGWSGSPAPAVVDQWQRCDQSGQSCAAISGATGLSYVVQAADAGSTLVVLETATNAAGSASVSSAATGVVSSAPQNTALPKVSGVAGVGQTLTVVLGGWSGSPAPAVVDQWQRCDQSGQNCAAISGATGLSYVVQAADAGSTLVVLETATNAAGSATGSSAATGVVSSAPQNTALPKVSGVAGVGQTLTVVQGGWSGSPAPAVVDQWQRCDQSGQSCAAISGATGLSYGVQAADAGSTLVVLETATNAVGSASVSSAATGVVASASQNTPPQNTAPPVISGTAKQSAQLTVSTGVWSGVPAPTYAYQWQRCDQSGQNCTSISGATGTSYATQRSDVGATLRAIVTGTNSAGFFSAPSSATARVIGPPVVQSPPTISGIAQQGSQLTARAGTWTGYPASTFAYKWNRCNPHGEGCSAISGQTKSSYTVAAGDVGFTLRLVSTAANSSGSASAISVPTAIVGAASNPSAASAWSAFLVAASQRKAALRIVIPASHLSASLKTLTVALPRGLSFSRFKRDLAKGITIKDARGKRPALAAVNAHGDLVLRFNRPTAGIQITISGRALSVSKSFVARTKQRSGSPLHLIVTAAEGTHATIRKRIALNSG